MAGFKDALSSWLNSTAIISPASTFHKDCRPGVHNSFFRLSTCLSKISTPYTNRRYAQLQCTSHALGKNSALIEVRFQVTLKENASPSELEK